MWPSHLEHNAGLRWGKTLCEGWVHKVLAPVRAPLRVFREALFAAGGCFVEGERIHSNMLTLSLSTLMTPLSCNNTPFRLPEPRAKTLFYPFPAHLVADLVKENDAKNLKND